MLDNVALKDLLSKNSDARRQAQCGRSSSDWARSERAAGVQHDQGQSPRQSTIGRGDPMMKPCGPGCGSLRPSVVASAYRRLHVLLRQEGLVLNRKPTQRLYREEGLTVRAGEAQARLPNASWSIDFVHAIDFVHD